MRVCVVGERGYIGSNLVKHLLMRRHTVTHRQEEHGIDCIVNCAGYGVRPGQDSIELMIENNINLPIRMSKFGYKRMIQLCSSSEIFDPSTAYARTKSLASDYLRGKATLVYIYTAWGGLTQHEHTFMAALLKAKRDGTLFHLSTPYATRDFVHIKHICRGIEELIDKPIGDYHFSSGHARTMLEVATIASMPYTFKDIGRNKYYFHSANPYFPDTFEEDLQEEICAL